MKLGFVVEGETEEAFVKQILRPHLFERGVTIEPNHVLNLKVTANRYNKVVDGPSILKRIGLPALRAACPHFASWLGAIEELGVDA